MNFLSQYGLFFLEALTIVGSILVILFTIAGLAGRRRGSSPTLSIEKLNEKYEEIEAELQAEIFDKKALKALQKKKPKAKKKQEKKRAFVIHFEGDVEASSVEELREEISAVLLVATPKDEVVVVLESGGGTVHGYGLGASQLQRIRDKKIALTVCIDKVAASGGYLMACVADKIVAAPFAIIGSIGVVMQLPNFSKLLKKNDINYEMLTAGEYKRTLTMFGENDEKGREKCQEDLESIHEIFKNHIVAFRPSIDIKTVATGEHWLASQALTLNLVDELKTSDTLIMEYCQERDVFEVGYEIKKKLVPTLLGKLNILSSRFMAKM